MSNPEKPVAFPYNHPRLNAFSIRWDEKISYIRKFVDRQVDACVALHGGVAGEAYNAAMGTPEFEEMYAMLSKHFGKEFLSIYGLDRKWGGIRHSGADISKMWKDLGYTLESDYCG